MEGRDEQVDVLAVNAPGVDALRNELRHEVLAAPGPAVGLGRGGVEVMAADWADDEVTSQVLTNKMTVQELFESRDVYRPPAGVAALELKWQNDFLKPLFDITTLLGLSRYLEAGELPDPLVERVARVVADGLGLAPGPVQPGAGVPLGSFQESHDRQQEDVSGNLHHS